jgi:protein-disulfide isomerase
MNGPLDFAPATPTRPAWSAARRQRRQAVPGRLGVLPAVPGRLGVLPAAPGRLGVLSSGRLAGWGSCRAPTPRLRAFDAGVMLVVMAYPTRPRRLPAGATPEGDGVLIGDGPVLVDAFIDFLCPFCRRFELSSGPALARLVADRQASVAFHPMNFLDEASTTSYSTRAAAASGCAADYGRFPDYAHALFVHQPAEGGAGLSDGELTEIGREAGLGDGAFAACVSDAPYLDWPPYVTARATAAGVSATPTVLVAGTVVKPEAQAIVAAVARAGDDR